MANQSNDGARRAFDEAVGLLKSRAYDKADTFLESALKDFPNDPNLLRLQGMSLSKQDRFAEAEQLCRQHPSFLSVVILSGLSAASISAGSTVSVESQ